MSLVTTAFQALSVACLTKDTLSHTWIQQYLFWVDVTADVVQGKSEILPGEKKESVVLRCFFLFFKL